MKQVITYPNKILTSKTVPVTIFDDTLHKLLDQMAEIMYSAPGVGLAGNQANSNLSLFIMDSLMNEQKKGKLIEVINPIIIHQEGNISSNEGCLSVPGFNGTVTRFEQTVLKFQDRFGNEKEGLFFGFESTIVQHEMDHLSGILFFEKLPRNQRRFIERKFK